MMLPKSIKYLTRWIRLFPTLCNVSTMLSFNWICQSCDNLTRKQKEVRKISVLIKKLKTRSTRKNKSLVEYKTVTDVSLLLRGSWVPLLFTETAHEIERNMIKYWQISKIHQYFLRTNIFKVITDIRKQLKNVQVNLYLLKAN